MKTLLLSASALSLIALAACGGPQDDTPDPTVPETVDTASDSDRQAAADAVLAKAESGEGPQIGDRIPEPEEDEAAGDTIAAAAAAEKARADEVAARGVTEIGWEELMPEGEEERLAEMYQAQMAMLYSGAGVTEGSAADQAIQIGTFNVVKDMDGMKIRLPGYTVPFEYGKDAQISEFLLVPYYGACLHAPPPPPNQTVFVKTDDKIQLKDLSQAVWIEGTLRTQTQESELADAAYTIEMTGWEIYEY
ncbi:MAG: DUF3299 domain-containing protein [Henriciella sp.]|uniref:DUF3299 domain-containing protein n=1 Tax=Henriciella sp. TaxID=1968823 RepID=UPI003C70FEE2